MSNIDLAAYRPILYPESIAVIGASNRGMGFGSGFLRTNLSFGYKGKLYPVNPKGGEIQGLKAYPSVRDIPYPVDFAVIAIPAQQVPDAIRECVEKGIKGGEILASGFKESGSKGKVLEQEIVQIARTGGMKLIGPNCFGLYSPAVGITLNPGGGFPTKSGPVGLISQSGGGACDLVHMSMGRGLLFSVVLSYGNSCDIDAAEMIRFFEADPNTKIVGSYLEGVPDGRSFFDALKSCARKKPVVIMKGGLSEEGYRGTMGHTGSLAGSKQAWQAAIKSAGAIAANDMRDLVDCMMAFNCLEGFKGGGLGLMAGGGSRIVEGLDAASDNGFSAPSIDDETADRIASFLPPVGGRGANPTDLANPGLNPATVNPIMEILADQNDIDFLAMYQMAFLRRPGMPRRMPPPGPDGQDIKRSELWPHDEIGAKAQEIRSKTGKPLSLVLIDNASDPSHADSAKLRYNARAFYTSRGIPCFDTGLQAFSVLRRVADYFTRREQITSE